jgi:tetratricopeptide (TPR) repeat protein
MKRKLNFPLIWAVVFFILFPVNILASQLEDTLQVLIKKNELQKALEFLTQYLDSNPENRDGKFYSGKIHSDGDSSFEYLSEIIDLNQKDEKSAEALLLMAKYNFLNGSYFITTEQTKAIEKNFDQSPLLPEALWLSGSSYLISGYSDEAEKQFRKIAQKFPGSEWVPWAYLGIGDCLSMRKEFDQVIVHYRKVIELYMDSDAFPLALTSLSQSYSEIKDVDNAFQYFNFYRDRFPAGISDKEKIFEKIRAELKEQIKKEEKQKKKDIKYTIEIGLFSSKNQAQKELRNFNSKGYTTRMVEVTKEEGVFWRVEVGIFNSRKKAESFKSRLEKKSGKTYKVINR